MKTFDCKVSDCGGSYQADVPDSPYDWTPEHWGVITEAMQDHLAAHPERLKVGMVRGCRCWGTCRCRPSRRTRTP